METITREIAQHVLYELGYTAAEGADKPPRSTHHLIQSIHTGSDKRRAQFAVAFPAYVAAYEMATSVGDDQWRDLSAIATGAPR